jgi:16S rRNA (uracil1498-N3)-methyltransferase
MPEPRLYLDAPLAAGARLDLDEAQAHKATTVLRLGVGARVRVFNERDGEWSATLAELKKRGVSIQLEAQLRPPRESLDVDLLFAPVKRDATDLIVEKATELGARRIRPVITARTITDTVRLDRLALIARSAAEQTERFDLPELVAPVSLAKALDGWGAARPLIFADEAGDDEGAPWGGSTGRALPMLEVLQAKPRPAGFSLLIGPEGGFTPQERALLRDFPFVIPVSLGPRILRAETAAVAGLTLAQAAWGDWQSG